MKLSPKIPVVTGVLLLVVLGAVVWRRGPGEKDPGDAGQGPGTEGNGLLGISFFSPEFMELQEPGKVGVHARASTP
jgi:hypothetical protein